MSEAALRDTGERYELDEDNLTSWADYRLSGDRIFIDHVESPVALRGTGAAGRLMAGLLDRIRAQGLKVVPVCPYAAAYIRRHPQYADLLA